MTKKRKYTEKMHRYRLWRALETKGECDFCPASRKFKTHNDSGEMWTNDLCEICGVWDGMGYNCPCVYYGKEEALKKAWEEVMTDVE